MTNIISMESKLEALERTLDDAERGWRECVDRLEEATWKLDDANAQLAKAIEAMEKYV